jgi:hypothetical protein
LTFTNGISIGNCDQQGASTFGRYTICEKIEV